MANQSDNSSVSSDELGLRLSCSSSSFDDNSDIENELENEQHDQGLGLGLQPYQFEPVAEVDVEEQPRQDDDVDRLGVAVEEWCSCHNCVTMPTAQECKCCKEIDEVAAKVQSTGDGNIQCITDHPGFATVCLDVFVLETAYYEYRQRYGHLQEEDIHMRYRYTAYRQLVRWCWGYVGRRNRLVLPACAVTKIRDKFRSTHPGNVFVRQDDHLLGSTYKKTVYRQFTDETFSTQSNREESWGILGNPIHAEVGETFDVVFKNLASRPYGFYIHGVKWVNIDTSVWTNGIDPDDTFRYTFSVSDTDGPSDAEGACAPYIYTSPVSYLQDAPTGVVGPLVICREGVLQNGRRTDVDNELFIFFTVFDENKSWFLDENIQRFAGQPDEVDKGDPEFEESNLMHGINGLLYNNLKGLEMTEGETTAWYLMGLGDEVDLHTVHFHGQTIMYRQEVKEVADVYELGPGLTAAVEMMSDSPGEWLLHCHVNDHILGGMETTYIVHALPTEPPMTTSAASRTGITCTAFFITIISVIQLLF